MALKDWTKIGNYRHIKEKVGEHRWLNLYFHIWLEILSFNDSHSQYKYKVYVKQNDKTLLTHPFTSESQALKFAKNYMRKH